MILGLFFRDSEYVMHHAIVERWDGHVLWSQRDQKLTTTIAYTIVYKIVVYHFSFKVAIKLFNRVSLKRVSHITTKASKYFILKSVGCYTILLKKSLNQDVFTFLLSRKEIKSMKLTNWQGLSQSILYS